MLIEKNAKDRCLGGQIFSAYANFLLMPTALKYSMSLTHGHPGTAGINASGVELVQW